MRWSKETRMRQKKSGRKEGKNRYRERKREEDGRKEITRQNKKERDNTNNNNNNNWAVTQILCAQHLVHISECIFLFLQNRTKTNTLPMHMMKKRNIIHKHHLSTYSHWLITVIIDGNRCRTTQCLPFAITISWAPKNFIEKCTYEWIAPNARMWDSLGKSLKSELRYSCRKNIRQLC